MQDAAHVMLSYDGAAAELPVRCPGAKDVGVEVHSMSKGFHMIGWRMGWVCGHERIVRAFADVKDNCDSGQFIAIQKAAAAALDDAEIPRRTRAKYRAAAARSWSPRSAAAASTAGCPAARTSSTRRSPKGIAGGPQLRHGRGGQPVPDHRALDLHGALGRCRRFLRFSVTYEAADEAAEDALMAETCQRLQALRLEF